jgi:hypothetical protein
VRIGASVSRQRIRSPTRRFLPSSDAACGLSTRTSLTSACRTIWASLSRSWKIGTAAHTKKAPGKSSESRGQEISLQKIVLTRLELCPSLWNALVRRRRVGRERRLRSEGNVTSGLGRPKAGSGLSRKRGARPSSARSYYGGAAPAGAKCGTRERPVEPTARCRKPAREGTTGRRTTPREAKKMRKTLG